MRRQESAAMNAVIHTAVFLDVLLDQRFKEKHFHSQIYTDNPIFESTLGPREVELLFYYWEFQQYLT